ncbi:UNVERIFIED_CONTAM: helix-turn-helix transcriptional regulator [Streptococcus canis]|uniref:HTH-type transcriptional regulator Xre n=1 Tax=Streptococcus canis TaxID=1329 RepID=A0A3P5Y8X7_STRCB|nr:helix-turn-helix transcriptional regulator [Streptococcus canis]MDV5976889.1 helix-turn-helix transcriptional regulator [Streptococcus canis]VDC43509.1 HTH-type transcriptional regulator Xre [Streptococcus canis]
MKKLTNFGENLRLMRKTKSLTQTELASKLNIGQSAYAKWENGRTEPTLEMLARIADSLDVTVDYLLGRSDNFSNTIVLSKNNMKSFSKRLKELRLEKNQTQQELADCLNVKRASIAKWETNRAFPNGDTIIRIAEYFDVPFAFFK